MADQWYPDLNALAGILQGIVGARVNLFLNEPGKERIQGFADVNPNGLPLMTADPAQLKGRPALKVEGNIMGWRGRGDDEVVRSYDAGEDGLGHTLYGQRNFTLSLKAEGDGITTHAVLERIRTQLGFPSVLERIRALSLAIRFVGDTKAVSAKWDKRIVDASIMEVAMSYGVEMEDTAASGDYIKTVTATGTFTEGSKVTTIGPTTYDPEA
jgi:hypothetical protein